MIRVALRSVRAHVGQFLLTTLAVVLGVSFLSGTLALRGVLSETFSALTASTITDDIYVTGPKASSSRTGGNLAAVTERISGAVADQVAQVEGVAAAHASSTLTGVLVGADDTPVTSNGAPTLIVPTFPDDKGVEVVAGRLPSGPGQVVLETGAMERSGLAVGDSTHLVVNGSPVEVTVVGQVSYGTPMAGATVIAGEAAWVMGLAAPDGMVDQVRVALAPGAEVEEVRSQIARLLPDARVLTRQEMVEDQNAAIEQVLGYVQTFLLVFVALALFVGSFIIMNTFAMSVRQRQKEFALLRAVGASPSSVFATVLVQALLIGTVGSLLGVAGGAGLTRGLVVALRSFGMPLGKVPLTADVVVTALVAGLGVTVVGALVPARDAALTPPVEAMRGPGGAREKPLVVRGVLGAVLTVAGVGAVGAVWAKDDLGHRAAVLGAGASVLMVGLLIVSPVLARLGVGALALPLRAWRPVGRLAARNLVAAARRTAATSAALLIGMALVTAGSVITASMQASVNEIVNSSMRADLLVRSAQTGGMPTPVPQDMAARIAQVDGVASTTSYRANLVAVTEPDGTSQTGFAAVVDPQAYTAAYDPRVTAGSFDQMDATHVAASKDSGLKLGQQVTVAGGNGTITATVVAVAESPGVTVTIYLTPEAAAAVGSLVDAVSTDPGQALASPHGIFISLADGASIETVRDQVEDIVAPAYVFNVLDRDQLSDQVASQASTMLAVIYGLLGLSLVIAVLGIVNTLVLSVSERTREIGLMRAVGLGRLQVAGEVMCESVLTAVYGTVLGGGVGVLLAGALRAYLADRGLETLVIPWDQLAAMLVVATTVGVVAAVWPAVRASRLPVLEAIASE